MDDKKFPVVEVFGPTVQGEGELQGQPCYFIRMGGCDYRCDWCDTPHAVLPELVRSKRKMSTAEIMKQFEVLAPGPSLVVISGGNPLLHDLRPLVFALHRAKYRIAIETQGTLWKEWIRDCESIAVSPKPPSSGHITNMKLLSQFIVGCTSWTVFLKVVVLDELDYQFAKAIRRQFPGYKLFLSACNDAGATVGNPSRIDKRSDEQIAQDLIGRGRWLANRVMVDPEMTQARVQMQQHVLYWGNKRGV